MTYDCMISRFVQRHVATCKLFMHTAASVNCLFLVGVRRSFCSSGLVVMTWKLLLVTMLGLSGLAGSAHFVLLGPWMLKGMWCLSVHLWLRYGLSILICSLPLPSPFPPRVRRAIT